jgi:hypothetical protein
VQERSLYHDGALPTFTQQGRVSLELTSNTLALQKTGNGTRRRHIQRDGQQLPLRFCHADLVV